MALTSFTARSSTSAPKPGIFADGLSLSVSLNIEPDGHWARLFDQQQSALPPSDRAKIRRPQRPSHPGLTGGNGAGIYWDADEVNGLTGDEALKAMRASTEKVDSIIADTNRRYLEEFVPGEIAKADAEVQKLKDKEARQKELSELAAQLTPPDDDSDPAPDDPRSSGSRRW